MSYQCLTFPPNCVAVVILRRFFIYDVNFVYNALCFLRLASRSSVNHIFIVLNKHFFVSCGRKIPRSFLLAIRTFPFMSLRD